MLAAPNKVNVMTFWCIPRADESALHHWNASFDTDTFPAEIVLLHGEDCTLICVRFVTVSAVCEGIELPVCVESV